VASYPRSLDTAAIAVCFKETAPGVVRLSFRSKGAVDVAALAAHWAARAPQRRGATAGGTLEAVERA